MFIILTIFNYLIICQVFLQLILLVGYFKTNSSNVICFNDFFFKISRTIKKVNENCNPEVGFDDTFKVDNHILSIVLRANGMIGWVIRNFISSKANFVPKICKTLIRLRIEYSTQVWKLEFDIKIERHTKNLNKNKKNE